MKSYLYIGDSISIDLDPGLDVQEREDLARVPEGLGAASLFFENDDERWPEFEGRDRVSRFARIEHTDLTRNGATFISIHGHFMGHGLAYPSASGRNRSHCVGSRIPATLPVASKPR